MTAIQRWTVDMVKVALGELELFDPTAPGFIELVQDAVGGVLKQGCCDNLEIRRLAEQRIACLLVQARALECRHISGELLLKCPGQIPAIQLSGWLTERSRKLESIAMEMAQSDGWPPREDAPAASPSGLILVKN